MATPDPQRIGAVILKLAIVSLLVGLVLRAFDIEPRNLLSSLGETAQKIFDVLVGLVDWTIPYILLGAVVVIPIWLIMVVLRVVRAKKG
ncbi:MAG: DUF6460 domain-containing protein [Rhodospirillales bacterium]|nr:DUF6460 domain-containing protein [Rhodospirillales bacterium]MCW8862258.1 DUF6460 domain-containing protein [Rhodospirillales bacterium]MCW8953223.1 DUF6460 domain-containing protein [Rhodospirillales bacterium]MCW8970071.1 DUF6460 domain-containing protein [Rhodospirillales bacterium]MCW9001696.1 DUF6460 domain-containing protein [Rhodospirillales bacterium]